MSLTQPTARRNGFQTGAWGREPEGFGELPDAGPEVVVIHTSPKGTRRALETAAELARGLAARVRIIVPQIVPYPRPLTDPPVTAEFTKRSFRALTAEAGVEVKVDVRYCRDRDAMLEYALCPGSLVVVGDTGILRPPGGARLAWKLRRQGYHVVMAEGR